MVYFLRRNSNPYDFGYEDIKRETLFLKKQNPLWERISKFGRPGRTKFEPFLDGFEKISNIIN